MRFMVLFILLAPLLWAQADPCYDAEAQCMASCCAAAGGEYGGIEGTDYVCSSAAGDEQSYNQCVFSSCRSPFYNCEDPSGACGRVYSSCMDSCGDTAACDLECVAKGRDCLENPGGCCGPSFLLGLLVLGAFCHRR